MQRLTLATLSVLALSLGFTGQAHAEDVNAFKVVDLARNGYFAAQGVSAYANLSADYQSGDVTAEDLIQAAIDTNRLSAEAINDAALIRSVELQLNDLHSDD